MADRRSRTDPSELSRNLQVSIPSSFYERLRQTADSEHRTISNLVYHILLENLEGRDDANR